MASETSVWQEPVRGGYPDPRLFGLPGIEQLRGALRGNSPAPPISRLTGISFEEIGQTTAAFAMPASPWLAGPAGPVPGGVLAILADAALGCALQSELPPATPYTTSEISLTMLRPVQARGQRLLASGQLIHRGKRVGLTEAFVLEDDSDRLVAHLTSRLAIFPPLDPPPEPPAEPRAEPAGDREDDPWRRPGAPEPIAQDVWDTRSGLEIMLGFCGGELPLPAICRLTGLAPVRAGEGFAEFALPTSEWLNSPTGRMQGGAIAMLAEAALSGAVLTKAPAATAIAPLDVKVNFLRPVEPGRGELRAEARVEHSGRTIAVAGAEVFNAEGKRVALATGSCMYLAGHPARLGEIELGSEEQAR